MIVRRVPVALLSLCALLAACAVEEDAEVATISPAVWSANNLAPLDELAARPDTLKLTRAVFKQSAITARMYDTAAGKYTLVKAAHCGLPVGTGVTITNNSGLSRVFEGGLGLIAKWTTTVPTTIEAGWFWGCLAAHLNATGTRVDVSLRGNHPAYFVTTAEKQKYIFEEAVWYGDGDDLYAAIGHDLGLLCGQAAVPQLEHRVCARSNPNSTVCPNITVVGLARNVCSGRSGNVYWGCKGGAKRYDQVTTTMLNAKLLLTCEDYNP